MVDVTTAFWDAVTASARASQLGEDRIRKLRSAQILRSLAAKSDFTLRAAELAKLVDTLSLYVQEHSPAYVTPGRCSEAERDKIEEEVGQLVKRASAEIEKLQAAVQQASPAGPATAGAAAAQGNPHVFAHRQGMALILAERLQTISRVFDRCRAQRYEQLLQLQRMQRARRPAVPAWQPGPVSQPQPSWAAANGTSRVTGYGYGAAQAAQQAQAAGQQAAGHQAQQQQQQQQQEVVEVDEAESRALQQELLSMSQQVRGVESSLREVATLNAMFSTQVMHQSEQIELLYQEAVAATSAVEKGNVHLGKAIKLNSSARLYVLYILLAASLCLLFLDWYSS